MSDDNISNTDQRIEDETLYAALAGAPDMQVRPRIIIRHAVSAEMVKETARRLYDINPENLTADEMRLIHSASSLLDTLVSENEVTIHR